MATSAYAGSETGNPLIFDADDTDPRKYMPLKADRAQRVRYPCHVGNLFKNVTELVYAAAAGTLPVAQFMSGRVLFNTGASGTITLPTATIIVTFLDQYYRQVLSRSSIYTNSNGNSNRIANEIDVEFYNATNASITLGMGAGLTLRGLAASAIIPANTIAQFKFVVVTTNPAAIDVFPLFASASGSAFNLSPQAPTQLVDYDPATGQVGYVTDAVISNTISNTTDIVGWDSATSTIRRMDIATNTPVQLFTRNTATGELVSSSAANVAASGPGSFLDIYPLSVDGPTGNVIRTPLNTLEFRRSTVDQVDAAADFVVVYDGVISAGLFCTYAAGVFTFDYTGFYMISVQVSTSAVAAASYAYLLVDATPADSTGNLDTQTTATITHYRTMSVGQTLAVHFSNGTAGAVTLPSGAPANVYFNRIQIVPLIVYP
jgi:hypothetical protein